MYSDSEISDDSDDGDEGGDGGSGYGGGDNMPSVTEELVIKEGDDFEYVCSDISQSINALYRLSLITQNPAMPEKVHKYGTTHLGFDNFFTPPVHLMPPEASAAGVTSTDIGHGLGSVKVPPSTTPHANYYAELQERFTELLRGRDSRNRNDKYPDLSGSGLTCAKAK